jgi:hypothetical protein
MALGRWPASRLAVLWLALLGAYWGAAIYSHRDYAQTRHMASSHGWDSVLAVTFVMAREGQGWPPAQREALLRRLEHDHHLRDSVQRALNPPARLNKAQLDSLEVLLEPAVSPLLGGLAQFHGEVSRAFTMAVLFFIVPLVGLVGVTIAWFVSRRRPGPPSSRAAA